jgi:hypothetical protein
MASPFPRLTPPQFGNPANLRFAYSGCQTVIYNWNVPSPCAAEIRLAPQVVNKPEEPPKPYILAAPSSVPEKLNEYWRVKLETELRSRRYSPKTRNTYIYFIRTLCRILQRTPEEISPDDVKQYLAIMEKKGYSASAMTGPQCGQILF